MFQDQSIFSETLLIWISDQQATLKRQKAKWIFNSLRVDKENCQVTFPVNRDICSKSKLMTGIYVVVRHDESVRYIF
jgi:hypothetical protein